MADSKSEEVGDCVKAAVVALALVPAEKVVKRKTPTLPEGKAVPEIVVSVGAEPATERIDARTKLKKYPVAVTIVTGGGSKAADDAGLRDWRERIDGAVDTAAAFGALAGFNRVTAGGGAPFDPGALGKGFDHSTQTFTVEVLESRT